MELSALCCLKYECLIKLLQSIKVQPSKIIQWGTGNWIKAFQDFLCYSAKCKGVNLLCTMIS